MKDRHVHTCTRCGELYECGGRPVAVEDAEGFTKTVCQAFHINGLDMCETCDEHLNDSKGLGPNGWTM